MSTKSDKISPRVNTEPFTFHCKSDPKTVLNAYCNVTPDTNMGVIINELILNYILKSKNIKFEYTDGKRTSFTVNGENGTLTKKLAHNLE